MNCCDDNDLPIQETPATRAEPLVSESKTWRRRVVAFFQWILPITTLALIPKCPMCVAAYVLLFTGVGLSLAAAAAIRWILIAMSIAAIASLSLRTAKRLRQRHSVSG